MVMKSRMLRLFYDFFCSLFCSQAWMPSTENETCIDTFTRCLKEGKDAFEWEAIAISDMWSLGADWLIAAGAHPGFCGMKWLGVFLFPMKGMLVHRRLFPRDLLGFPNNSPVPIYTDSWGERDTVRVKCLTQVPDQDSNQDRSIRGRAH